MLGNAGKCWEMLGNVEIKKCQERMKRQICTRDPSITVLPEIDIGTGHPLKVPDNQIC